MARQSAGFSSPKKLFLPFGVFPLALFYFTVYIAVVSAAHRTDPVRQPYRKEGSEAGIRQVTDHELAALPGSYTGWQYQLV